MWLFLLVTAGMIIPMGLVCLITAWAVRRKLRKETEHAAAAGL